MTDLAAATFKLPINAELTVAQQDVKRNIASFIRRRLKATSPSILVLNGDAGTGKSLVLDSAFLDLQQQARQPGNELTGTDNKLLVNHNEMLKIYRQLAGDEPALYKKDFMKPTPFINAYQKHQQRADVVMVDEGHLLLTRPDPFNNFKAQNQLTEILKVAKVVILVFDFNQLVKLKSYWSPALLKSVTADYYSETVMLHTQMRVGDPDVNRWIDRFVQGKLTALPRPAKFDLRVFEDGQPMYQLVKQRNQAVGLSRMLATGDFPFTVMDQRVWYVTAGTLKLPWDQLNLTDEPWAEIPSTIDEVGSIYTIQGFDLNYAGIILGPSIQYDRQHDCVVVDPSLYEDKEAFKRRADLPNDDAAKQQLMFNAVNILLKRAKRGLYIYAVDHELEQRLLELSH